MKQYVIIFTILTSTLSFTADGFDFREDRTEEKTVQKTTSVREKAQRFEQASRDHQQSVDTDKDSATEEVPAATDQGIELKIQTHKAAVSDTIDSLTADLETINNLQKHYEHLEQLIDLPPEARSYSKTNTVSLDKFFANRVDPEISNFDDMGYTLDEMNEYKKLTKARQIIKNKRFQFKESNETAQTYSSDPVLSKENLQNISTSLEQVKETLKNIHNSMDKLQNKKMRQKDIDTLNDALKKQLDDLKNISDPTLKAKMLDIHAWSEKTVSKMQKLATEQAIEQENIKYLKKRYNQLTENNQHKKAEQLIQQIHQKGNDDLYGQFYDWLQQAK